MANKIKHKDKLVNFKMSTKDYETVKELARKFKSGNTSEWIRTRITTDFDYEPTTDECLTDDNVGEYFKKPKGK
jgi:hypothetical protein